MRSRWLMQESSVLLPEPEGPMMHITLPARHIQVNAAQNLAPAIALGQSADAHHRLAHVWCR